MNCAINLIDFDRSSTYHKEINILDDFFSIISIIMDDSSSYQKEIDILKKLIVAINLIISIVLRHTK